VGGIAVGSKIIILHSLNRTEDFSGKVGFLIYIYIGCGSWPYKLVVDSVYVWADGVPYSPLMAELV